METLYPSPCTHSSSWFGPSWTKEENKKFESALAIHDKDTPDRWMKIAAMIPGKSAWDVRNKYIELEEDVYEIEAGRNPIHGYPSSPFMMESMDWRDPDASRKRSLVNRGADQERKKGVPWTEEEHRRFLMGLLKYGKGDWRNISRNFVISKTPTQVASHAQKYFIRQLCGGKDKRRPSIHDITTYNLTDTTPSLSNDKPSSIDQKHVLSSQQKLVSMPEAALNCNFPNDGGFLFFDSDHGNLIMSNPYTLGSDGMKMLEKNAQGGSSYCGSSPAFHSPLFGIHSTRHQIH